MNLPRIPVTQIFPTGLLALLALILCGCGSSAAERLFSPPQIQISTAPGSDWTQRELSAVCEPVAEGWLLSITSAAAAPAGTLLLEARFDPRLTATAVEQLTPAGELNLLVAGRPGVLALGVIMPAGQSIPAGTLLRARLVPATEAARSASRAPVGDAGAVPDLTGVEDGVGGFTLSWGYYNSGDYDQNSEANIADLTPLAGRLQQPTTDGDRDGLDAVLDGDRNGEVNVADLTPLGMNYLSRLDGYRIYSADGPDIQSATSTQVAELAFTASTLEADARRQFATTLSGAALTDGAYYFVAPYDQIDDTEGAPSNVVQYIQTVGLKYRVPPAGNWVVDTAQSQNPSLVLLPAIPGLAQAGAPVIVYTTLGGGGAAPLMLAYFDGSAWQTAEIGGGENFSFPRALWLPGEQAAGPGIVVAYDVNALSVVERRFDEQWAQVSATDVGNGSGVFSRLSLDVDPASGALGVAHAYTELNSGSVEYSQRDSGGSWTTLPVYDGDSIGGLSFRFDPGGGAAWLLFTHGTFTTDPTYSLDYSLEQGRLNGGVWSLTPIPHPDSPYAVDLAFRADGTPQLVGTAARDITIDIPFSGLDPITASLLFDVITGEYSGEAWSLGRAFESNFGLSFDLPSATVVLELDLASDAVWARPDEILFGQFTGSVDIDIATQMPTDGGLDPAVHFLRRLDGGSYSEQSYYGGEPGRAYSWAATAGGQPVCAYVRVSQLTASDVMAGDFEAAGELSYWQP